MRIIKVLREFGRGREEVADYCVRLGAIADFWVEADEEAGGIEVVGSERGCSREARYVFADKFHSIPRAQSWIENLCVGRAADSINGRELRIEGARGGDYLKYIGRLDQESGLVMADEGYVLRDYLDHFAVRRYLRVGSGWGEVLEVEGESSFCVAGAVSIEMQSVYVLEFSMSEVEAQERLREMFEVIG